MEKIKVLNITVSPKKGQTIDDVCSEAKMLADSIGVEFEFEFNGVKIRTENHSINDMIKKYMTQQS